MGFIISRNARDKYRFEESLFNPSGNIVFKDFAAVRRFAAKLKPIKARAGEINAMSLIHEIFQYVVRLYLEQKNPQGLEKAAEQLQKELDKETLETALSLFAKEFPSPAVYHGQRSISEYMDGTSDGIPNRQVLIEELLLMWLTNVNPACDSYKKELFPDAELKTHSAYLPIIMELERFFGSQPFFGPNHQNLVAMLRSPAIAVPHSLHGQLEYIREYWGELLGDLLTRLLSGLDLLKEEEKARGIGPGQTLVYDFSPGGDDEYERFTADVHWMPRLVMMAKSTYVWLDQLSKKYRRPISRLDQIPDEELDQLGRRGFTGLWLIGVWERSRASQQIKQRCGNPEALASAYSIYEYRVAEDLGGEGAMDNLKHRAWQRGIRLASDMVPNHMGIDSPWLVEHPDRFLSLNHCPYPSYSFNGPNLSSDPRASIFLEDHYYDRTDAAVVFKWVNNQTGEVRYIYHGNDGTSMPWNDTAQLNYLNPETREAVVGAIFFVAAKFPIIRFDAAMTLTKRHYQRLWFPEPGSGGDIPTRAAQGMTKNEFNSLIPEEFWRQVVDRFAAAHSDTLLLAEAFWLMETYFVRTLGMHRVYNSAFMYFLKNEDNAKFRTSIKNILQFNPEILKRFVNFVNNPDEETAVAQFGKGDKYFGVCTLMVTLPGLPMFGHGQVEGFTEKYGMEYRRAYWDETPDEHLVNRHEKEIFPLVRKRYLFAEVQGFLLYDFYTPGGWVNEDVIAYSNRCGNERCLVVYHNRYAETAGWIKTSVPGLKNIAEGLGLTPNHNYYTIFRDHDSGMEYIRNSKEWFEKGLYVELNAYRKNVFLDFREVEDNERGYYSQLAAMLQGKGAPSLDRILREHFFNPLLPPFKGLMNAGLISRLMGAFPGRESGETQPLPDLLAETREKLRLFLEAVRDLTHGAVDPAPIAAQLLKELEGFLTVIHPDYSRASNFEEVRLYVAQELRPVDSAWFLVHSLEKVMKDANADRVWQMLEDWLLSEEISRVLRSFGAPQDQVSQQLSLIKLMMRWQDWWKREDSKGPRAFFSDPEVMKFLEINRHNDILWFRRESMEECIPRLFFKAVLVFPSTIGDSGHTREKQILRYYDRVQQWQRSLHRSGCRVEVFINELSKKADR